MDLSEVGFDTIWTDGAIKCPNEYESFKNDKKIELQLPEYILFDSKKCLIWNDHDENAAKRQRNGQKIITLFRVHHKERSEEDRTLTEQSQNDKHTYAQQNWRAEAKKKKPKIKMRPRIFCPGSILGRDRIKSNRPVNVIFCLRNWMQEIEGSCGK